MNITVVGSGYVGLVSGACLADVGNSVCCLDIDAAKIAGLQKGIVPIHEPGLDAVIARNLASKRISFTTDTAAAIDFAEIIFIAVGTPSDEDGSADVQYVLAVATEIGRHIQTYKCIINKSTVPVGTADLVKQTIQKELSRRQLAVEFSMISNPEFLKEGAAIDDFMRPDRIIVGCEDSRAEQKMRQLYAPFLRNHDRLMVMDIKSAELSKYAANAMLATRISFMNELALVSEKLGADIEMVRQGIGADPRIGFHFLYPGCGYGGSCFPKDVRALIYTGKTCDVDLQILTAVAAVNERQKHRLTEKMSEYYNAQAGSDSGSQALAGKHFALWGLAFKPGTDDMREAPSCTLIDDLTAAGATITAYDPVAMPETAKRYAQQPQLSYADSAMAALADADALIIVTEWKEFRSPDFSAIKSTLKTPLIFDGRNMYPPAVVAEYGISYHALGRPTLLAKED